MHLSQPFAVKRALAEADVSISKDIDGIAFTRGPGMEYMTPMRVRF